MKPSKILCAVDFSARSRVAMQRAASLAHDVGAELLIIHVVGTYDGLLSIPKVQDEALAKADEMLEACRHEAASQGVKKCTAILATGTAWDMIVRAAREQSIELIVVGTHGRTGLEHALIGSVAEKVVRHAACDVLVVR